MHLARLYRSQADIQSHRKWLKLFVDKLRPGSIPRTVSTRTYTSTQPVTTQARKVWRSGHGRRQSKLHPRTAQQADDTQRLLDLRDAIKAYDVGRVDRLYDGVLDKRRLSIQDLSSIGQCIHYAVRLYNQTPENEKQPDTLNDIIDFTNRLIQDIQGKKLAPAPNAHKHILGALKEAQAQETGVQFWQWLEAQDDEYLNHDVYAAAIELLAVGDMPLSGLEELYSTCLTRFPGTFLAYHLSPNAIVDHREREISINDIPMLLLQAITTARLLRGDTHNAYMALDSALRLRPTSVPQRLFNLFMDERPILEGFTVFAIACRSGQPIGTGLFRRHLAALRQSIIVGSLQSHICIIRIMIAAIYLHLSAGGQLKSNSISELVIAITRVFRLPGIQSMDHSNRQRMVESALGIIKKIFESFARYGILPHISAFNSIIVNIGGHGRSRGLADVVLADMEAIGLRPNAITRRSLVAVGGLLGDDNTVLQAWRDIVRARNEETSTPDDTDFIVLMKAASSTNQMDFAQNQYRVFQGDMSIQQRENVEEYLNRPPLASPETDQQQSIDSEMLLNGLQAVNADLDTMNEQTHGEPDVQDFGQWSIPVHLLPFPDELSVLHKETRSLYDELTTERGRLANEVGGADNAVTSDTSKSDVSSTNLQYGVLRYENWKSINYLLSLSEKHDQAHRESVDCAISAGERPPQRDMRLTGEEQSKLQHFGLSDFTQQEREEEAEAATQTTNMQEARAEILRLRGV